MTASDVADTWTLVASEGEMKVYKREVENADNTIHPLKAVHTVKVGWVCWWGGGGRGLVGGVGLVGGLGWLGLGWLVGWVGWLVVGDGWGWLIGLKGSVVVLSVLLLMFDVWLFSMAGSVSLRVF